MEKRISVLNPIYQSPAALVLGIATQEMTLTPTILRGQILELGQWRCHFRIIGESHWVRLEKDGQLVLQEILACVPLPASECLHHYPCKTLHNHTFSWNDYSSLVQFNWQADLPHPENGLMLEFPAIFGQTPVTCLNWEAQNGILRWWTLHTYPLLEGAVCVRSYSKFCYGEL